MIIRFFFYYLFIFSIPGINKSAFLYSLWKIYKNAELWIVQAWQFKKKNYHLPFFVFGGMNRPTIPHSFENISDHISKKLSLANIKQKKKIYNFNLFLMRWNKNMKMKRSWRRKNMFLEKCWQKCEQNNGGRTQSMAPRPKRSLIHMQTDG